MGATSLRLRVDRIEDEVAVVALDGRQLELSRLLLPPEAREGDVVVLSCTVDREAGERLRADVAARRARLGAKDDGGDFSL